MPIEQGPILLAIARAEISAALGKPLSLAMDAPWLHEHAATFVTLTQAEKLRGCIGSLEAYRPLVQDVKANALAAAFHDPRFTPLTLLELDLTRVEVSLLSATEALNFKDEHDALTQLRPHIDGIVFEYQHHRSCVSASCSSLKFSAWVAESNDTSTRVRSSSSSVSGVKRGS